MTASFSTSIRWITKISVVVGFAGLLITVAAASGQRDVWWLLGTVAASASVLLGGWAFFPRNVPQLLPEPLRTYLSYPEDQTSLMLYDTIMRMHGRMSATLQAKAARLKWSLVALGASAILFGVGTFVGTITGGTPDAGSAPAGTPTAATSAEPG